MKIRPIRGVIRLFLFGWMLTYGVVAHAQWAARVIDWQFGTTQTIGQSPEYFPANVLGPCDPNASRRVPSSDPHHICSLGRNGWIILEIDPPIANREGADFVVFENAFEYGNGRIYDEWLQVEVSNDGEEWYLFPFDTLSGEGFAGRTPTEAGAWLATDPVAMGGDAFDLQLVGLETARYVRLTDATRFQAPDRLGADLDAVRALYQVVHRSSEKQKQLEIDLIYDSNRRLLEWRGSNRVCITVWTMQGTLAIPPSYIESSECVDLSRIATGLHIVEIKNSPDQLQRFKMLFD